MEYKVSEASEIAGVTVRTLHHYDHIGLLRPGKETQAGYRLYTEEDLERLQQILFFKELDFSLKEIKDILDSPDYDRKKTLEKHHKLLLKKKDRLEKIIKSVENTIDSINGGKRMDNREMFDGFDMSEIEEYKEKYAEEVRNTYDKEVVDECQQKTANYTEEDWAVIQAKGNEIYKKLASLMDRNPDDPQVQQIIGEYREYITANFYNCTLEIFRGLGDLYINDPRFTKNIDKVKEGLSEYLRKAMHIYCDNQ